MPKRARTALVTGATGSIGQAIAAGLAAVPETELIVVGRDPVKVARLVSDLAKQSSRAVRGEIADLASLDSIRALARRCDGPLDVLINNAAVAPPRRQQTEAGIELVLATNVLGYVWLTRELVPALRTAEDPRVVNVASYWAGDLDLDDLEFTRRVYDNDAAYRQSKQANRMLTVAWAERLREYSITVNSCHPGDVNSSLSNQLGFGGSETPAQGAATPLRLANAAELRGVSGRYFERGQVAACRFASDRSAIDRLARICDTYG